MKGTMFDPPCCGTKSGENPKENVLQRKKKVMKVSSHVQEHRKVSVLQRNSQQMFRRSTEAGSFRNACLFWQW
jgi:hypothetical protein